MNKKNRRKSSWVSWLPATLVAFGIAALAARRLPGRVPAWGWGMLALATAMAYSRLYVGVHWPTDVATGAVLGLACCWAGVRLALRRPRRSAVGDPEPAPVPSATPVAADWVAREVEYEDVMKG